MHRAAAVVLTTSALVAGAAGPLPQASALQPRQKSVVSARAAAGPQVVDGVVYALAQVGTVLVAGGSFTRVESADPTAPYARRGVVAYDTVNRTVSRGFAPQFNGTVRAVLAGPTAGTVYVAGEFTQVAPGPGKAFAAGRGLVLLRLSDGSRVRSFVPPAMNGTVQTVKRFGHRLYVGGSFTTLAGKSRGGLADLDADTGAVLGSLVTRVAVHHSWTPTNGWVKGSVGVNKLDLTPDGKRLVAIGNFKEVAGQSRDQIAMWDLGATSASLRTWHPPRYDLACSTSYDSYVRDVDFSPDGSYLVVAATGGHNPGSLCDSAARFETAARGPAVAPTWVSTSGADSLLSTAVTGEAVYLGGHQRWLNNAQGGDIAGPGAVPRPGVGAVDPATGMPLAWNPGRHPRGAGTYALVATPTGLWMGSDQDRVNRPAVRARKVAFFPLAGGRRAASKAAPSLPVTVYSGGPGGAAAPAGSLTGRRFDGSGAGPATPATSPLDVDELRGTTTIGNTLFYGTSDGRLYERSITAAGGFGPEAPVDPYDDPTWSSVRTGSGGFGGQPEGQTYRGVRPDFYDDISALSSMFYDGTGRLYYTFWWSDGLWYRDFSPDIERSATPGGVTTGGVIHPERRQVPGVTLPSITGAFLTGGSLYYVRSDDGLMYRVPFNSGHPTGTPVQVGGAVDWRSRALFLTPTPTSAG